jgi:hypothetical protein
LSAGLVAVIGSGWIHKNLQDTEVRAYTQASLRETANILVKKAKPYMMDVDYYVYSIRLRELENRPIFDRVDAEILRVGDSYEDVAADVVAQLRHAGFSDTEIEELWSAQWKVRLMSTCWQVDEFKGIVLDGDKPAKRCTLEELCRLQSAEFLPAKAELDRLLAEAKMPVVLVE